MENQNKLQIISCQNCFYYRTRVVDKNSTVCWCNKRKFLSTNPQLLCNKTCYRRKKIDGKNS